MFLSCSYSGPYRNRHERPVLGEAVSIVHCDDDLVVVHKPPSVSVSLFNLSCSLSFLFSSFQTLYSLAFLCKKKKKKGGSICSILSFPLRSLKGIVVPDLLPQKRGEEIKRRGDGETMMTYISPPSSVTPKGKYVIRNVDVPLSILLGHKQRYQSGLRHLLRIHIYGKE